MWVVSGISILPPTIQRWGVILTLTPTAIKAIESILSKGYRAEVIPTKEGPKVTRTVREVAYDPKKETRPG